jgi:prolyl-tRNA editing enzyme YbaK/EbsC (Cys-tRNA(Pro) deacylase)
VEKKNSSVQRVQKALDSLNVPAQIKELPSSTRTAREAADAVGCQVGQIVKSLVFRGVESQQPYIILTSGSNKVDEKTVAKVLGETIKFASAVFVREETGFAIGGVSPFGLKQDLQTYIDQDLLIFSELWAAAGSPNAVFRIQPDVLVEKTGGIVIPVH